MRFSDILMVAATQGGGAAAGPFTANAFDLDGSTQYLERGADFTGNVDAFTGILSVWLRFDGGDGVAQRPISSSGSVFRIVRNANNTITFTMSLSAGGAFAFGTVGTFVAGATWYNFLASWDTNFSAGNKVGNLYVNDVRDYTVSSDGSTAQTVDYTQTNWGIGEQLVSHAALFNGCMSEFYFAPGQYLDFSNSANRRKFISATGKPVSLGTDGSTPTGTAPIMYLKNVAASCGTNSGTGGDLTPTGTPTACSSSPST